MWQFPNLKFIIKVVANGVWVLNGGNQSSNLTFAVCRPSNPDIAPSINRTILASHGFYTTAKITTRCITTYAWSFHCQDGPSDPNCNPGDGDVYRPAFLQGLVVNLDAPSLEIPPRAFVDGNYLIKNHVRIRGISVFNISIRFAVFI